MKYRNVQPYRIINLAHCEVRRKNSAINTSVERNTNITENTMFNYGIIFLLIALVAAALGFGFLAGVAATAAKIVFIVGIILFIASLFRGTKPRDVL
ncbi:hypothetical protein PHYNN_138 [Pantoea phage Phynn]|nr:hypothetical protein PHYNN_138 [Pantoea phage Phynn]